MSQKASVVKEGPLYVRHWPEAASHSLTVLSAEAVMSCWESGLHETEYTPSVWPLSSTNFSLRRSCTVSAEWLVDKSYVAQVPSLAIPDDALLVKAHSGDLLAVGREAGTGHETRVLSKALLEP